MKKNNGFENILGAIAIFYIFKYLISAFYDAREYLIDKINSDAYRRFLRLDKVAVLPLGSFLKTLYVELLVWILIFLAMIFLGILTVLVLRTIVGLVELWFELII
ncbi:MAG: hypothetical protein HDS65_00295 [Bacteroidales bacterium]|nr:hypothetical protein [Bacteroidales bacterium]